MKNDSLQNLVSLIIDHSLSLRSGELLWIKASPFGLPLVEALYERALEREAHVELTLETDRLKSILLRHGVEMHLSSYSPTNESLISRCDAFLTIRARDFSQVYPPVSSERLMKIFTTEEFGKRIFRERWAQGDLRWYQVYFPTKDDNADKKEWQSMEDSFIKGCFLDQEDPILAWKRQGEFQQEFIDFLKSRKLIHIKGRGTDLTLDVKGCEWANLYGQFYLPDGEVGTAPHIHSAEGTISFQQVNGYFLESIKNVELMFERGRLVSYRAQENEKLLRTILNIDRGTHSIGELSFGLNPCIQDITNNTLFDEKIYGTIHIALGSGGQNASLIHWDMVFDLRENSGEVWADNQVIFKESNLTNF